MMSLSIFNSCMGFMGAVFWVCHGIYVLYDTSWEQAFEQQRWWRRGTTLMGQVAEGTICCSTIFQADCIMSTPLKYYIFPACISLIRASASWMICSSTWKSASTLSLSFFNSRFILSNNFDAFDKGPIVR
jgi:hypothetical protein